MSFNPLGSFDANSKPNAAIVKSAKAYIKKLPDCPVGSLNRIYAHWTVGHYTTDFADYNTCVRFANHQFGLDITHNPQDNAKNVNDNKPAPHTYERNTGAFGIAVDAMFAASENNYGPEPITMAMLEWLCAGIGAIAFKYNIDLSGQSSESPYANEPTMMTHAEAANHPGNPAQYANYYVTGERWDLCSFVPLPAGMTNKDIDPSICGNALRQKAHLYKQALGAK